MQSIAEPSTSPLPTRLATLPPLLAYMQGLGLDHHLDQPTRGVPTVRLALVWLVLTSADLRGVLLLEADLTADLTSADLTDASLRLTDLTGANLTDAIRSPDRADGQ